VIAPAHRANAVAFRTKPQITAGLIRQTVALGIVPLDWITADEEYGTNGGFLDEVERLELRYMVEVPVTTTVWTVDPASCVPPYGGRGRVPTRPSREAVASVAAVASGLGRAAWRTLRVREGAKGPLAFEFAAVRVWAVCHGAAGPPVCCRSVPAPTRCRRRPSEPPCRSSQEPAGADTVGARLPAKHVPTT